MKRLTVLSLAIALPLGSVTVASGQCALPGFSHLPPNTSLAFGPIMRYFAVNYPLEVGVRSSPRAMSGTRRTPVVALVVGTRSKPHRTVQ